MTEPCLSQATADVEHELTYSFCKPVKPVDVLQIGLADNQSDGSPLTESSKFWSTTQKVGVTKLCLRKISYHTVVYATNTIDKLFYGSTEVGQRKQVHPPSRSENHSSD